MKNPPNRRSKNLAARETDHEIVQHQNLVNEARALKIQIKGNIANGKILQILNKSMQGLEAVAEDARGQGLGHVIEIQGAEVIQEIVIVETVQVPEIVADETAQAQGIARDGNVSEKGNLNENGNVRNVNENGSSVNENGKENVSESGNENANVKNVSVRGVN